MRSLPLPIVAAVLLTACGSERPAAVEPEEDPAVTAALGQPLTTDPDLASMNRANSAASLPSQDGSVPPIDAGPELAAAARADALALVGGPGRMRQAPEPPEAPAGPMANSAQTAGARAATAPGVGRGCASRMEYTMAWAARMPAAFPVYPRGAVQEAAGTDAAGCALRVVNFQTPVPLDEVIDFYFTQATLAGFSAQRELQGGDDVLAGRKGGAAYVVYARSLPAGLTEVDLVTSGR